MQHPRQRPVLAVTCGEPAGIGPEIALRAAWQLRAENACVLIGDAAFLALTAARLDPAIQLVAISLQALRNHGLPDFPADRVAVVDCPLAEHVVPGQLDPRNGRQVLETLNIALEGVRHGWFEAMVTAPLQKSTINQAGISGAELFTGHTEYLAQQTGTAQVVMMLAGALAQGVQLEQASQAAAAPSPMLRVALATTHLALKDVPAALDFDGLLRTLQILHSELQRKFGLAQPRILVTGLNPHAGESGYLGREEIDIITPVLQAAQAQGIDARGPYPADTLFQPKYLEQADCVLAMYHDQGLPVLKYATFGHGVNITLGLPLIRTSVDHGTALDLASAGVGHADHGSMLAAIGMAAQMVAAGKASPA
jgi:4-hydroxythreonine-4-phosphate dehydrogenase